MKKTLIILIIASCLFSCTPSAYKIKGTVDNKGLNGATVFLKQRLNREWISMDSVVIKNNEFSLEGRSDTAKIVYLSVETSPKSKLHQALILENGNISVRIDTAGFMVIGGTIHNDSLQHYQQAKFDFYKRAEKVYQAAQDSLNTPDQQAKLYADINLLNKEEVAIDINYSLSNIKTIVGTFIFTNSFYDMSTAQKEEILNRMDAEAKQNDRVKQIIIDTEIEKRVAVGKTFTDFRLPSITGDSLSLSDLVGKTDYVLIDFWATWCGPCMRSLPGLEKLYNKYKGVKLQVLGVSLDEDGTSWKNIVTGKNLKWKHVSDLKGWKCQAARLYAVNSIPSSVLIDKNGKIVGRNLNFEEIGQILTKK
jgi:peroxiredoxin